MKNMLTIFMLTIFLNKAIKLTDVLIIFETLNGNVDHFIEAQT